MIVDDNAEFVASASRLLERQGLDVVGSASTGTEALELFSRARPDVVLLDVELGGESGFDIAAEIAAAGDETDVVLISTHTEEELRELVAAAPVVGFLPKSQLTADAVASLLRGT
jgi:DNA-binding NarL/FixJ family response regulator